MRWQRNWPIPTTPWQPDLFGPKWIIGFNITPVVSNIFERWIKGM
jgi:hypothetical protein